MKYRDVVALFQTDHVTDPKSGKRKAVQRYVGPRYRLDEAARRRGAARLWLMLALAAAAMLTGGFLPNRVTMGNLVAVLYLTCLLPLMYLLLGTVRISRMKATIDEFDRCDGLLRVTKSGLGLGVLAVGWLIAGVVQLCTDGLGSLRVQDAAVLACAAAVSACGFLAWRTAFALQPEEIPRPDETQA